MGYETTNSIIIRGKSEEIKSLGEKIKTWLAVSEGKDDENWVNYIGKAAFKGKSNSGYEWSDIGYVSMLEITDGALLISEDTEYGPELDLWHSLSKKYLTEYELDYISIYDDTINTNVKDFEWKSCITNYDTGETFGDYEVENDHFKYCDYDEKVVDLSKWDDFKSATGFIVGFEIGEPQDTLTYVEDLNRAVSFPVYTTGIYHYPVYYGKQTHINALLIEDVDTLCNSNAQWAIFLADSGMTADSSINDTIREVIVNKNQTDIKPYMFRNLTALYNLDFRSFTGDNIGDYAFENCSSLLEVPTNDNITRIGTGAYKGCTSLRSYTIGKATKYIGAEAFLDCNNTIIEFENKNSGGAWFVGPERIKVDPNILSSSTLKQYLTDTYANEYWEWKQIPNDWNWVDVYPCYASFTYEMNAERNGVQLYVDGEKSRVLYDGEHVIIMSERVKVSVKFEDNLWKVFIDDELRGYFEYVTE